MVSDQELGNDLVELGACPYNILGVPERSDVDICKQAFRALILKNHPDKNADKHGSKEITQRLNYAKDCLDRREWKDAYDRSLLATACRNRASSRVSSPSPPSNTVNVNTFTKTKQQPKQTDKPKQDKAKQQKKRHRRTKHQEAAATAATASQQPGPASKKSKRKKTRSGKYTNIIFTLYIIIHKLKDFLFFTLRCRNCKEEGSSFVFEGQSSCCS